MQLWGGGGGGQPFWCMTCFICARRYGACMVFVVLNFLHEDADCLCPAMIVAVCTLACRVLSLNCCFIGFCSVET